MIGDILPASVRWSQSFTDRGDVELFPEERAVIANAVAKRQAEFTTVRACAREALAQLGHAPAPLIPGTRGAPGWPDGVAGSMTHCLGYRAAVVGHAHEIAAVGIDAEPLQPLPDGVLEAISRPEERTVLAALTHSGAASPIAWDRVLFSIKESIYKAWYPVTGKPLDFPEASVRISPDGTFTARLLVPAPQLDGRPLTGFDGRWTTGNGLVVTSIVVQRAG
ncbi:4'-phosphopantetheinyl transferase [Streptomyces sp. SM12]|uniref:4'-phosphopantetheinyl transferase family protein n=1 Tax=Streptomyces sp. SM12 TaxID=1071602 RepID=UPI000CD5AF0F|nr:4'-phosphopantetheinyl transferase superfamily protein [Streptomyces sp. SM12]